MHSPEFLTTGWALNNFLILWRFFIFSKPISMEEIFWFNVSVRRIHVLQTQRTLFISQALDKRFETLKAFTHYKTYRINLICAEERVIAILVPRWINLTKLLLWSWQVKPTLRMTVPYLKPGLPCRYILEVHQVKNCSLT